MMNTAIDALVSGTAWFWLVLGLVLIITEVLAPTFWLLWPGLAALAVGLLTTLTGSFDWRIQGIVFAGLAVAATLAGRRYVGSRAKPPADAPTLNRRAEQYKGRRVRVGEAFAEGRGRIAIDDTIWRAQAADGTNPAPGETVEVIGVEGTILRVKTASAPDSQRDPEYHP